VAAGHRPADRFDSAGKLDQYRVAGDLDQAAAECRHVRLDELDLNRLPRRRGGNIVTLD
jgi:hypothetical protein